MRGCADVVFGGVEGARIRRQYGSRGNDGVAGGPSVHERHVEVERNRGIVAAGAEDRVKLGGQLAARHTRRRLGQCRRRRRGIGGDVLDRVGQGVGDDQVGDRLAGSDRHVERVGAGEVGAGGGLVFRPVIGLGDADDRRRHGGRGGIAQDARIRGGVVQWVGTELEAATGADGEVGSLCRVVAELRGDVDRRGRLARCERTERQPQNDVRLTDLEIAHLDGRSGCLDGVRMDDAAVRVSREACGGDGDGQVGRARERQSVVVAGEAVRAERQTQIDVRPIACVPAQPVHERDIEGDGLADQRLGRHVVQRHMRHGRPRLSAGHPHEGREDRR